MKAALATLLALASRHRVALIILGIVALAVVLDWPRIHDFVEKKQQDARQEEFARCARAYEFDFAKAADCLVEDFGWKRVDAQARVVAHKKLRNAVVRDYLHRDSIRRQDSLFMQRRMKRMGLSR